MHKILVNFVCISQRKFHTFQLQEVIPECRDLKIRA